jgi:hypothetical protein
MRDQLAFVKARSGGILDAMQSVPQAREQVREKQCKLAKICIGHTHMHIEAVKVTETEINKHRADPE